MFEHINAVILQHPELLAHLKFLFIVKYWCYLILTGFFVYLAYFGDSKKEAAVRTVRADKRHFLA
jgi:hypothetical protein